jgi:serine/threonine protein kinase
MLLAWYNSNFGKCKRRCNGVSNSPFLVDEFIGVCNQWCKHGRSRKWANHIASRQFRGSQHKCPFESTIAIDIVLQFANAMWYFHNRKIARKDLKSTNVLCCNLREQNFKFLDDNLYVKLVDFGIFKLYNKIETNGTQSSNKGTNIYVT